MATIESRDVSVEELFRDFYVVPSYQREYVWGKEQVGQLLDDIRSEQLEGNNGEYFIGSVVICPSHGSDGSNDLIDGQQRVTTLFILLCAIRDRLSALGDTNLGGIKKSIADVDTDKNGNDCFRAHLEPQYDDAGDAFKCLIEGRKIEKKDTLSIKNIHIAYETSQKFLIDELDDDREEIRKFFGYLIKNVKLIKIYTDSFGRALKIFETINDRGIGLNSMDLLKNLLFMNATDRQFNDLKGSWKVLMDRLHAVKEQPLRFLRYFIFATWGVPRLAKDELYDWLIKNDKKIGLKDNPVGFSRSLESALEAYAFFLGKKDRYGDTNLALENISLLYRRHTSARQYLVLLLAGRHLSIDVFSALCKDMESFLFVCVLIKEEIRTFEALFARWSLLLSDVHTMDDYRNFSRDTFQKRKRDHASKFYTTFKGIDEKSLPKYQLSYVLGKLTQAVDKEAYGSVAPLSFYCNTKEVHIEHILPRSPSPEAISSFGSGFDDPRLVWSIGNLALVEKSINVSFGNKEFGYKKNIYPKSRFLLTRTIAERPDIGKTAIDRAVAHMRPFEEWNKEAIRQRAAWLADLACIVWDVPVDELGKE